MKILIIGYGSIGRRHFKVLLKKFKITFMDLVTKQNIINQKCYKTLAEVENIKKYDYFVISSETNKHFEQLKYLESKVKNKKIFCEKPLFEKAKKLKIINNKVFVGYVLRFHPLLIKAKKILKNEKIININAKCGSYLPTWRQNIDYKNSSSAKKEGGGVLLDLSHEMDYIQWLCGKIVKLKSYQLKVSDLDIESDDLVLAVGKTKKGTMVNFSIDYFSKIAHRVLMIDTNEKSLKLDFIKNTLIVKDKNGKERKQTINMERNDMFYDMHYAILNDKKNVCSFKQGQDVMSVISKIQGSSNE